MKVNLGISNHHVHLSSSDYKILFGDSELTIRNNLNQPGQFASNQVVTVKGEKDVLENMVIVGPLRDYTQVEISMTDSYKLGVKPPVRSSGDLKDASLVTIIGPYGKIERECCIIANRHIHVDKKIREEKKLIGVEEVSLKINGEKSGIINHVMLKDSDYAYFEVHLDTDDANAFLLKNGDELEIIK